LDQDRLQLGWPVVGRAEDQGCRRGGALTWHRPRTVSRTVAGTVADAITLDGRTP
jgi:hypothetical protein